MWYSLYNHQEIPQYERDKDGNIVYVVVDGEKIPVEIGSISIDYDSPNMFFGSLSMSGGEADSTEYGIDLASYGAVLVTPKGLLPIDETSRIWVDNEPTVDENGYPDGTKADWKVVKLSPSLNVDKYLLQKVVK